MLGVPEDLPQGLDAALPALPLQRPTALSSILLFCLGFTSACHEAGSVTYLKMC